MNILIKSKTILCVFLLPKILWNGVVILTDEHEDD